MESPFLLQYCIRVMFQESLILPIDTIQYLSVVSRDLHNIVKPYIENNYWFVLSSEGRRTAHYQPKRVRNIKSLSQVTLSANEIDDTNKKNFLNNITHLTFDYFFKGPIEKNHHLPQNIVHLSFGGSFNSPIDNNVLPPNVKILQFGEDYNKSVDHLLPVNLEILRFGWSYNSSVDHLPPNLKILELGFDFNTSVDHLPPGLEVLRFGWAFNKNIDSLPHNLKILHLGWQYNKPFNTLPINLEKLSLGHCFNQFISSLPPKVVHVEFRGVPTQFNHPVSHLNPNIKFYTVEEGITRPYKYNKL